MSDWKVSCIIGDSVLKSETETSDNRPNGLMAVVVAGASVVVSKLFWTS